MQFAPDEDYNKAKSEFTNDLKWVQRRTNKKKVIIIKETAELD